MKRLNNKGITLIALVITIIVLLILAGVTIATLTGENGILTRASEAQIKTRIEQVREQVNLWNTEKEIARQTNTTATSEETFLQNLKDTGIVDESEIDRENQIITVEGEEIYYGGELELTDIFVALYTDGTLVFNSKNEFDESIVEINYGNIKGKEYNCEEDIYAPWYDDYQKIVKVDFLSRIVPNSTASWFYCCNEIKAIENLNYLKVDKVTDMSYMFSYCEKLENIDVSSFNTSNVTNMYEMFGDCYELKELDLSEWDTSNVTNMSWMFFDCTGLLELNLSNFNTSKVTDMSWMFASCNVLPSLDLSSFDTSNVTDMNSMFASCKELSNLDLDNFDTSKVTNMSSMFVGTTNLNGKITIRGNIDISNTDNYVRMFSNAATNPDSKFVVNYVEGTSSIVDILINTKSENSNVIKGEKIE